MNKTAHEYKKKRSELPLILAFIVGIGILLYPTSSNYYNVVHQSGAIVEYEQELSAMDNDDIRTKWEEAVAYNKDLYLAQLGEDLPEDALRNYDRILRVSANGMMGYIDIESISVHLPIYHGTSEGVLQKGVGHLEWSSLPVGGENTHAVLTGHTGLTSARLFTDLEKMQVGDTFVLTIVGETLTYEVEEILTVRPEETHYLEIVDGKDLCTLLTCTPYGVNTHRLLIKGHRTENAANVGSVKTMEEIAEERARVPMLRMILLAIAIIILLLLGLFWGVGKKKELSDKEQTNVNQP